MQTTTDLLDALKAKLGVPSDYALAPVLGKTRSQVSKYRNKKDFFTDETVLLAASLLEIEPPLLLAAIHAERAKNEAEKAAWKSVFEKLGGMAAALTLGIMLSAPTPSHANTGAGSKAQSETGLSIHYTKRRRRKGGLSMLMQNLFSSPQFA